MLKRLFHATVALAFTAGVSYAAIYSLNFDRLQPSTASVPVLSACGGTTAGDTGSSDTAGTATQGGTVTTCTITFGTAFAAAPSCIVSDLTGTRASMGTTIATTGISITGITASDKLAWICFAKAGG